MSRRRPGGEVPANVQAGGAAAAAGAAVAAATLIFWCSAQRPCATTFLWQPSLPQVANRALGSSPPFHLS